MLCSYSRATLRLCVFQKERVSVCLVKPIIGVPKPQCGQSQPLHLNKRTRTHKGAEWMCQQESLLTGLTWRRWESGLALLFSSAVAAKWPKNMFFLHCCFLRFSEMRDGHKSLFDSETRDTPKGTSCCLFVFSGADIFSQISPKWEDEVFQARTLIWDVVALEEPLFKKDKK